MQRSDPNQIQFVDFSLPFAGHLRADNRWISLARTAPWDLIENLYASKMASTQGAPSLSGRIAFGALLIKERLGFSDEETPLQIAENPYLQYFLGLDCFREEDLEGVIPLFLQSSITT